MARYYRLCVALAFAFGGVGLDGCLVFSVAPVERASSELACAPENINVISRDDIAFGLFDVEACGRRARYNCVYPYKSYPSCTREPDPAVWDPDPASLWDLLQPPGTPPTGYREAHMCPLARGSDCNCFELNADGSRFHPCAKATSTSTSTSGTWRSGWSPGGL